MKFFLIFSFVFITYCSGNKVSNYHGSKSLENKFEKIILNSTNKNDLYDIIGPPSSVSDFDKNKWYYFERLKTNQSLIKLGRQKIQKNNILILELTKSGVVKNKQLLDINDMNNLSYIKEVTSKDFKNDSVIYGVFSSLREKINAPLRNRK